MGVEHDGNLHYHPVRTDNNNTINTYMYHRQWKTNTVGRNMGLVVRTLINEN